MLSAWTVWEVSKCHQYGKYGRRHCVIKVESGEDVIVLSALKVLQYYSSGKCHDVISWKLPCCFQYEKWHNGGKHSDYFGCGLRQWETTLHSNARIHSLRPYPEWSPEVMRLIYSNRIFQYWCTYHRFRYIKRWCSLFAMLVEDYCLWMYYIYTCMWNRLQYINRYYEIM